MQGVILFGDSVFFGVGASAKDKGCGRILKRKLGYPVLIKSRSMITAPEAYSRLASLLIERPGYDIYVVMFGNNDCRLVGFDKPLVDLGEYASQMARIAGCIKAAQKLPIFCDLQPISDRVFIQRYPEMYGFLKDKVNSSPSLWQKQYSDCCVDIAQKQDIPLVGIRQLFQPDPEKFLAEDGLHPNDKGHALIADYLSSFLKNVFK